jgi:hypothetical protein
LASVFAEGTPCEFTAGSGNVYNVSTLTHLPAQGDAGAHAFQEGGTGNIWSINFCAPAPCGDETGVAACRNALGSTDRGGFLMLATTKYSEAPNMVSALPGVRTLGFQMQGCSDNNCYWNSTVIVLCDETMSRTSLQIMHSGSHEDIAADSPGNFYSVFRSGAGCPIKTA